MFKYYVVVHTGKYTIATCLNPACGGHICTIYINQVFLFLALLLQLRTKERVVLEKVVGAGGCDVMLLLYMFRLSR